MPTTTRRISIPAAAPTADIGAAFSPAATRRSATSSHWRCDGVAQSTRTGSFSPFAPDRNGSGNDPTTAGMRIAAPQSWRSHQIRSPACTLRDAAPSSASMPLT